MKPQLSFFGEDIVFDHSRYAYPSQLACITGTRTFEDHTSSYYGIVLEGGCTIERDGARFELIQNMYFGLPGGFQIQNAGKVVLFRRWGYRALPTFGGPTEIDGRLSYIDTSRASILIPPARMGDPVLNLLVFPPNVIQSPHQHPTTRLGCVISGSGKFVAETSAPLETGMVFALDPFKIHSFNSGSNGLAVVAYHPDSDVGPTDELHPMKSRTYLIR
ncbi:MAG: cupin domain-containing protein [Bdellovibrionaceae bacterium]|nr:cupin domain-containing protein [Pseudobdellovibrionaceae bacterium]